MRARVTLAVVLIATTLNADRAGAVSVPKGTLVEGMQCLADVTQTYTLYLPTRYAPDKEWPVLLIFDPRGRSVRAAEIFQEAAERWGWVLISSNDTRSDGPMAPNHKALNALWPEVHERYAVDKGRIYAAGLSGGGHVAYMLGQVTGGLAGIIAAGSRLVPDLLRGATYAVFACAGDRDFNYQEMRDVDAFIAKAGNPHRFEVFQGLHTWMPADLAREALTWMELVAMRRGLRPPDDTAIAEEYERGLAAARGLEIGGDLLAALRRYRTLSRTFDGLITISVAQAEAERLEKTPELKKVRKAERRHAAFEERMRRRFLEAYTRLRREEEPIPVSDLRLALNVAQLEDKASAKGLEGATARRLLSTLYAETSYYVGREMLEAKRWEQAVAVLTVATEVYDGWGGVWPTWYNLACAHARNRQRNLAIRALQRAVEEGYANVEYLRSDPDLESLHDMDEFREIVNAMRQGSTSTEPPSPSTAGPK